MKVSAYEPDFLDYDSRINMASLAELHDYQIEGDNYRAGFRAGEYMSRIGRLYNADLGLITGDVVTLEGLKGLLDGASHFELVRVIDGDEDRKTVNKNGETRRGWRRFIRGDADLDVEADHRLEGPRFSWQPFDYPIWVEHEPRDIENPDERLFNVDPRLRGMDYDIYDIPEEFSEPVFAIHAHEHRPQEPIIWNGILSSQGGYTNPYGTKDVMPDGSLHVYSFGEDEIDTLHIDVENDEVFEHFKYRLEDGGFRKSLEYCREGRELSPLEKFRDVPEPVIETEKFRSTAH